MCGLCVGFSGILYASQNYFHQDKRFVLVKLFALFIHIYGVDWTFSQVVLLQLNKFGLTYTEKGCFIYLNLIYTWNGYF